MADLKLYSSEYTEDLLNKKQNVLKTDDLSITLTDTPDGTIIRATGSGAGIPVDDEVDPLSPNPVKSSGIAHALDAKQDVLTSANAGDNVTITTDKEGKVKINAAGGGDNAIDTLTPGSNKPITSNALYAAIYGTQNSYSPYKCGMPYMIVNTSKDHGSVDFEQYLPDDDKESKVGFHMENKGIYVFWDNDWSHESTDTQYAVYSQRLVRWPYWFAPPLFGEVQIHIFNHHDEPLKIVWPNLTVYYDLCRDGDEQKTRKEIPGGWKWFNEETNEYDDRKMYISDKTAMEIPGKTTTCITLIHSFDGKALLNPERKVHAILCKKAYDYTLSDDRSY